MRLAIQILILAGVGLALTFGTQPGGAHLNGIPEPNWECEKKHRFYSDPKRPAPAKCPSCHSGNIHPFAYPAGK